jgi:hypothetical protein
MVLGMDTICKFTVRTTTHFHLPTVKDSPHPQASVMFGFLNENLALCIGKEDEDRDM